MHILKSELGSPESNNRQLFEQFDGNLFINQTIGRFTNNLMAAAEIFFLNQTNRLISRDFKQFMAGSSDDSGVGQS